MLQWAAWKGSERWRDSKREPSAAPTKGAALAILAKLHVYAASPYLTEDIRKQSHWGIIRTNQLFPAKDDKKWQTALNALQRFIDYAKTHYHLYKEKDKDGELNAEESLYQLFQVSLNNPEAIWQTSKNSWGDVGGEGRERRCTPRAYIADSVEVGVLQEAIDDFYMNDGKKYSRVRT